MRLLKSFSYMSGDITLLGRIIVTLNGLRNYYRKFNMENTDEALSRALLHAVNHYDGVSELEPYLKALGRKILSITEDTPIEGIEETVADTSPLVEDLVISKSVILDARKLITEHLFSNLDNFLKLGVLLQAEVPDLKSDNLSNNYKLLCRHVLAKTNYVSFISAMKELYSEYSEDIRWFLEQGNFADKNYIEVDYSQLNKLTSKRVSFVDTLGQTICTPEDINYSMYVKGIGSNSLARIRYSNIYSQMLILLESSVTNPLVAILDKRRIIRTCGGSYSLLNTDISNIKQLFKDELIMNLLNVSKSRLITVGDNYVYIIKSKYTPDTITLKGLIGIGDLDMEVENIDYIEYRKKEVC